MATFVDTRHPVAVLCSKQNIVAGDYSATQYAIGSADQYVEGTDAATGASGVVTVDGPVAGSTARAADTGALAAGTYAFYAEVTHPSAAAANREVLVQHRDAANAATLATLLTAAAGSGKRIVARILQLNTNERIRLVTGSDATNANIAVKVLVAKLD